MHELIYFFSNDSASTEERTPIKSKTKGLSQISIRKNGKEKLMKIKEPPLEEIERLKGYKYERKYVFNEKTMRTNTILICKYDNCHKV